MRDVEIRAHERAIRAELSSHDEARIVIERVRTGKIALEAVALAASLGDPVALLVAEVDGHAPRWYGTLEDLLRHVGRDSRGRETLEGKRACVRGLVRAFRCALHRRRRNWCRRAAPVLDSLDARTREPSELHVAAAERALGSIRGAAVEDRAELASIALHNLFKVLSRSPIALAIHGDLVVAQLLHSRAIRLKVLERLVLEGICDHLLGR